jgi:MYND finger
LEVAKKCPQRKMPPPFTMEDFKHPSECLAPSLHTAVVETLKGAFMCCPFHGSVPGDPSSELARNLGATTLKAFYAMGVKAHEDWRHFAGVDFTSIMMQSYFTIPGLLRDPNILMPYERPNTIFETAIVPILACPEPWLEKGVKLDVGPLTAFLPMPPQANHYMELCKQAYEDAMDGVLEGGTVQEGRAIARAKAMATLQCGYVGCRTVMLPGQKSRLCSGCKVVQYCSERCLKADWKKNHKIACKAIAAGRG